MNITRVAHAEVLERLAGFFIDRHASLLSVGAGFETRPYYAQRLEPIR
jgi:hypothetical protein